jgi:hypothetical protein
MKLLSDKCALKLIYKSVFGEKLDLQNPQTFNEKLQWLKLYNRRPEYTQMVDKYKAKEYVASIIGEEYIIPTLGVWDKFEDIDFDALPNQFVLKCTHGSGDVVICKDKGTFDFATARKKLTKSLKTNYYRISREWPYKNVPRKIIAEQYMEDEDGGLKDYKVYCFNGEARILMIASDRFSQKQTKFDYFDCNYNWLDLEWGNPRSTTPPTKPSQFETIMSLAEKISHALIHARIDFYIVGNKIYFGEITFFDGGGFSVFTSREWDKRMGEYLQLPSKILKEQRRK